MRQVSGWGRGEVLVVQTIKRLFTLFDLRLVLVTSRNCVFLLKATPILSALIPQMTISCASCASSSRSSPYLFSFFHC